ncbi:MAG: fibronectin type III domain-containing protein [Candidatus Nanopelagicales bacterium]
MSTLGLRTPLGVGAAIFLSAALLAAPAAATDIDPAAGGVESVSVLVNPRSAADGALGAFSALGAGMDNGLVLSVAVVDDTVYAGGDFTAASGVAHTRKIAAWSSVDDTWSALGTGTNGDVVGLAVVDDTLYAGGKFSDASGVPGTARIAAWSTTADDTWYALGTGMDQDIYALAADDDTVYAGGFFTSASGVAGTDKIAAWSTRTRTWSALGTGVSQDVYALAVSDDTTYVGGYFTSASGVAGTDKIAAWSPRTGTWSALGTGMNSNVYALAMDDDTLYAGGFFTAASGVAGTNYIAAWRDDTWHALGTGVNGTVEPHPYVGVRALAVDDTRGLVYAGGPFTATNTGAANSMNRVGVWDSAISEWIPLTYAGGNGVSAPVYSLAVDDSVLYVGGSFTDAGGVAAADRIARWSWQAPQGSNTLDTTAGASVTLTGEGFIGVPATGGVKVGSTVATYTRDDSTTITMTVPAGSFTSAPIEVNGVGGWGQVGLLSVPGPPPPVPAGPPTAVGAVAGDASATVLWSAPASTGSFPVTNYQVMSAPSGGTCLTMALTCEVTGLVNGTDYTFTVRALTGAGWSSWSQPSEAVTPQPIARPSILITGSRGEVRGKPGVVVDGTSTGLAMGGTLEAWVRFNNEPSYQKGRARILVDASGEFTWQRRTMRTIHLQVRTPDGGLTSNSLTIRAR